MCVTGCLSYPLFPAVSAYVVAEDDLPTVSPVAAMTVAVSSETALLPANLPRLFRLSGLKPGCQYKVCAVK